MWDAFWLFLVPFAIGAVCKKVDRYFDTSVGFWSLITIMAAWTVYWFLIRGRA